MLPRLERATAEHHAAAEADLFRVLDEPTSTSYRRFLATAYQFQYAVESRLVLVPELALRFVTTRLLSGALGSDLLALGADATVTDVFSRRLDVPRRFEGPYDALGWIYVLQRNTLHHGALFRALAPRLRGALHIASRYLTAHANDVHQRWHQLGAVLDEVATAPERADQIVDAAHEAFGYQHLWYSEVLAPAPMRS